MEPGAGPMPNTNPAYYVGPQPSNIPSHHSHQHHNTAAAPSYFSGAVPTTLHPTTALNPGTSAPFHSIPSTYQEDPAVAGGQRSTFVPTHRHAFPSSLSTFPEPAFPISSAPTMKPTTNIGGHTTAEPSTFPPPSAARTRDQISRIASLPPPPPPSQEDPSTSWPQSIDPERESRRTRVKGKEKTKQNEPVKESNAILRSRAKTREMLERFRQIHTYFSAVKDRIYFQKAYMTRREIVELIRDTDARDEHEGYRDDLVALAALRDQRLEEARIQKRWLASRIEKLHSREVESAEEEYKLERDGLVGAMLKALEEKNKRLRTDSNNGGTSRPVHPHSDGAVPISDELRSSAKSTHAGNLSISSQFSQPHQLSQLSSTQVAASQHPPRKRLRRRENWLIDEDGTYSGGFGVGSAGGGSGTRGKRGQQQGLCLTLRENEIMEDLYVIRKTIGRVKTRRKER